MSCHMTELMMTHLHRGNMHSCYFTAALHVKPGAALALAVACLRRAKCFSCTMAAAVTCADAIAEAVVAQTRTYLSCVSAACVRMVAQQERCAATTALFKTLAAFWHTSLHLSHCTSASHHHRL